MPLMDGLKALSLRWMQPIQQHGRRIPSFSSETTRVTCSVLVSIFFGNVVQQIHSLRARGVRSSHLASALGSADNAFFKSAGKVWAVPPEIDFGISISYQVVRRFVYSPVCGKIVTVGHSIQLSTQCHTCPETWQSMNPMGFLPSAFPLYHPLTVPWRCGRLLLCYL